MKKICILLLALGFFVSACNNDKGKENTGTTDREKDDYLNNGKEKDKDIDKDDNEGGKWSAKDVRSFNSECDKEMKDKIDEDQLDPFCSCMLDKFQDKFSSFAEFNKESTEEDGVVAAKRCAADLGIKTDKTNIDNNDGGEWTAKDEERFMGDCERDASKTVGATRANQYCDCMLQKIKKQFSSYAAADKGMSEADLKEMAVDCTH